MLAVIVIREYQEPVAFYMPPRRQPPVPFRNVVITFTCIAAFICLMQAIFVPGVWHNFLQWWGMA